MFALPPETPDWTGALCAQIDPDLWFPERGCPTHFAKRICRRCPLQAQCLEWALTTGESQGVWGGVTGKYLTQLRNARLRDQEPQQEAA